MLKYSCMDLKKGRIKPLDYMRLSYIGCITDLSPGDIGLMFCLTWHRQNLSVQLKTVSVSMTQILFVNEYIC